MKIIRLFLFSIFLLIAGCGKDGGELTSNEEAINLSALILENNAAEKEFRLEQGLVQSSVLVELDQMVSELEKKASDLGVDVPNLNEPAIGENGEDATLSSLEDRITNLEQEMSQ